MVIYKTTNLINGKQYIGKDEYNRNSYLGSGVTLKLAIKKYGRENFKKEIIEYCINSEHLKEREEYWLNYYDVANNLIYYNRTNKSSGYKKGRNHSETTKKLMSQKRKGYKDSDYTKQLKSQIKKGKPSNKLGYKCNDEQKEKMRKPKSEEWKEKMKKPKSEEHKKNMSLAKINKPSSNPKKPIIQLDLYGFFIREYPSISEAIKITNIKSIPDFLKGKQKHAGGFLWVYKQK
jgi:group I intron endonuclease